MYCEKCNLDFPVGLRYCKWCGQGLVERPRITSELYTCPSCLAAVQPKWSFCKSCGINLVSGKRESVGVSCPLCGASNATGELNCTRCGHDFTKKSGARKGNESARSSTALIAQCPSCGENLDTGSKYCKSCGASVSAPASPFGASSLLCNQCTSFSPLGSRTCRVCGASFDDTDSNRDTRGDAEVQARQSTLPDLPEHLSERERAAALISTEGMSSPPQNEAVFENETIAFEAPAFEPPSHESPTPEMFASETPAPEPPAFNASAIDTPDAAPDQDQALPFAPETVEIERISVSAETEMLPGVGPESEMPSPTANFQRRTTNPVEHPEAKSDPYSSELTPEANRVSSSALTLEAFQLEPPLSGEAESDTATGQFGAIPEESGDLPGGTIQMGALPDEFLQDRSQSPFVYETEVTPPPESGEAAEDESPEDEAPEDEVAETIETEEAESEINTAPTMIVSETPFEDVHTAPFGLVPPPAEPQFESPYQSDPFNTHSDNAAIPVNETEVIDTSAAQAASDDREQMAQPLPPYSAHEPPGIIVSEAPPSSPKSSVTIASIAIGVVMICIAVYLGWWYLSGGSPRTETTEVTPPVPATSPAPPPAPTPTAPTAPEGMALVASGTYKIGRDEGDQFEKPEHMVSLKAFYIDRTEVTNASYKKFIDATGHRAPEGWKNDNYQAGQDNFPVTGLSWKDAADYAAWAGKRLPTEEEWEAAARGADGRIYPWGNDWDKSLANIDTDGIKEVGQYPGGASPVGALDMIGNVWEWTASKFNLYAKSPTPKPELQRSVTYRVIRGGAYDGNKQHDASYRGFVDADKGYDKTGFRCAKDAKQ